MTEESKGGLFSSSFKRAIGGYSFNNDFIEHFYTNLIGHSEEIATMFKSTNMSAQKTMLHDSLYLMVDYYQSNKLPIGMSRIAEVHSRRDKAIPEQMYDIWLDRLIATVAEFDPEFNEEVESAWREVLAPGISYMKGQY